MYLLIGLGWTIYFFIHSLLASNIVKLWIFQQCPVCKKYYRFFYNIIAFTGLIMLLNFTFKDSQLFFQSNIFTKTVSIFSFFFGLLILAAAFIIFDKKEFLGLKELNDIKEENKLIISGIYKFIRHPLYSGTFFILISLTLWKPSYANALFMIISIIYIEIGSRLEEKKLLDIFGTDYVVYRSQVKRYFPFIY